jgi:hypothetical protein
MMPLRLHSRIALGLSPTPRPGLVLLPLGMALGPAGLNLLSPAILSYLDPAVSVALAALGVFAGLGLDFRRPREGVLLTAASLEASVTIVIVGAGVLVSHLWFPVSGPPLLLALMLGISAAVSSTASGDAPDQPLSLATRVGDLDDVLPILLSGLVLASMSQGFSAAAVWLAAQTGLIALVIALAGWFLVAQVSAMSEGHVFVAGTLLLLGGTAAYLSMSALWVGLLGGIFWSLAGGPARDSIERDMRYLEHPLIVLLLLVAGAQLQPSAEVLGLVAVYLLCRGTGKLAGGWLVGRAVVRDLPSDFGGRLIAPGVIAVAFAVSVLQADADSEAARMLLAVAAIGSLASELLSVMTYPQRALP